MPQLNNTITPSQSNSSSEILPQIREATIEDLDIITQYTLALNQHEDDRLIPAHQDFEHNLKNWLALELKNSQSLFLLAEKNNRAIGFIGASSVINDNGFLANPVKGLIQLLWVDNSVRRHNVAAKLVEEIELCFKQVGIEYIECSYTCINNVAKIFWDTLGYSGHSITARKFI